MYTKILNNSQWSASYNSDWTESDGESIKITSSNPKVLEIVSAHHGRDDWTVRFDDGDYVEIDDIDADVQIESKLTPATLPNGVQIFNTTPHSIRFWHDDWDCPVTVDSHCVLNAKSSESVHSYDDSYNQQVEYVTPNFSATPEGNEMIGALLQDAPHAIIVGSLIAAQAYAGRVVGMVGHPDYMRVPPAEKRMLPNKFSILEDKTNEYYALLDELGC